MQASAIDRAMKKIMILSNSSENDFLFPIKRLADIEINKRNEEIKASM